MPPFFEQLSFISAILAGFAFTVVVGLLPLHSTSRVFPLVFAAALAAALLLMIASVAAVLTGLGVAEKFIDSQKSHEMLEIVSEAFLLGIISLVVTFGCCGWLHSKRVGIIATTLASLAACVLAIVIIPFLRSS